MKPQALHLLVLCVATAATPAMAQNFTWCYTNYPDAVFCDDFDRYCNASPWPYPCAEDSWSVGQFRELGWDSVYPECWEASRETAWPYDPLPMNGVVSSPFSVHFPCQYYAQIGSSAHDLIPDIQRHWGTDVTNAMGTDQNPLHLDFTFYGQSVRSKIITANVYLELATAGKNAMTNFVKGPVSPATGEQYPILCAQGIGEPAGCPSISTAPLRGSIAVGSVSYLDRNYLNNYDQIPATEYLCFYDGRVWWQLDGTVFPGSGPFTLQKKEMYIKLTIYRTYIHLEMTATDPDPDQYSWCDIPRQYLGGFNTMRMGFAKHCILSDQSWESCAGWTHCPWGNGVGMPGFDNIVLYGGEPRRTPVITVQPQPQAASLGDTATFSIDADGTTPLTYQWQKNQVNLVDGGHYSGCTTATLMISSVDGNDVADYRCVVTNPYGTATSNAAALTLVPPGSPTITQQPSNLSVVPGGTVTFAVTAVGPTLAYQWQKNQANLSNGGHYSGCTTPTLTVATADSADQASYRCVITNSYGSATSDEATLTVTVCSPATLVNGDFEGSNTGGVAAGWTAYQRAPNPTTVWTIGTVSPPTGGGLQYQQIANTSSVGGAGVRQDVTGCTIGATYTFSGWMRTNSASATCTVKCSPAASTSWETAIDLSPPQTTTSSTWVPFSGTIVAAGTSMTLWLDGQTGGTGLNKASCFDSVTVTACYTPDAPAAGTPTNVGTDTVTWNWSNVAGESGYRVYDAASSGTVVQTLGPDITGWTETGIESNTSYSRWVTAYGGSGESARTPLGSATTLARPCPENGDFEGGFTGNVGNHWTRSGTSGTFAAEGSIVRNGAFSQKVADASGGDAYTSPIYQKLDVQPNRNYAVMVYHRREVTNGAVARIGINCTGGTTQDTASESNGTAGVWVMKTVNFTSGATGKITVLLSAGYNAGNGAVYFDGVYLAPQKPAATGGTTTICSSQSVDITASGGWSGADSELHWYTGAGGSGTHVGTGTSLGVSPTATTTYYPRWEPAGWSGTCRPSDDGTPVTVTIGATSTITQHPTPQSVPVGGTVQFVVAATSEGTLAYQWQKNQSNLSDGGHYSGATTATLTVSSADAADAGNYRCVVSAGCGSATSNEAALTVITYAIADFDHDGDVDLSDFAVFQLCFTGPNRACRSECNVSDFDHDSDVDLSDFAVFQSCFKGPNRPAGCP